MKFLAVSANTADPRPYIEQESARVAALTELGVIEHIYLKADFSGAVLIIEAADAADAEQHLASLPLVQHDVTTFTLTALVTQPG